MDQQTTTQDGLGFFFPPAQPRKDPTKKDLAGIKFRGQRTDLEVYHLAYGTKKLKACTYRRMKKRQDRINKKKAALLLVKSPEEKMEKAQKQAWLRKIQEIVVKENLKATPISRISLKKAKGAGKKKRKQIRKIKQKIAAAAKATETEMKD